MDFLSALKEKINPDSILTNELMSAHTTFRVGGPAKYYVSPGNIDEIRECINIARQYNIEYTVVGNGSNLLVSDEGYDGMILAIGRNFADISIEDTKITAKSGASLASIFSAAKNAGLAGFEFAAGIPGTLGGACFMNAGAYDGEMKDVLLMVTVLDNEGAIKTYDKGSMNFSYRKSSFQENGETVLEAVIELSHGNVEEITQKARLLAEKRMEKQPLEYPSAGSTFKRPEGFFAGALIEQAGLKGAGVGGACVSEKHAGFIINRNNASAKDIYDTINFVIEKVKDNSGITLEPEIRFLGSFS